MNLTRLLALAALFPLTVTLAAQDPVKIDLNTDAQAQKDKEEEEGALKKYDAVVTKKAVSQSGLFKVHRIDDKVLFEIPESMLSKELLFQTEISELPVNSGYVGMGMGTKVICFTRRGNKLFMRACDYSIRAAGADEPTKLGVQQSNLMPIIMAFDVQTEGKDEKGKTTAVVDVTSLYTTDPADFSVKGVFGGAGVDSARSFVDRVKAFPQNIETRSTLTFISAGRGGGGLMGMMMGPTSSASTVTVHYSLIALPEKPMVGRLKDSRIGYFTQDFEEYGRPENRMIARRYINRFRLEKKDPEAAVSEPVKPIVFYVSREVPTKWREAIKKGVEDWQPAFEQAGFKNAIIAKDAPTKEQDPNWDPEDARYSVIRWAPSSVQNAMGPSIQDPRSGETLSAHVIFWNNITELVENWYFAQCAAIDPAARKLPMNDNLMNELVRYVAAHEIGHTLGLEHNMKGSAWYTAKQLRDPAFTSVNGVSASIMDYSRFNYVAQPGDGVTRTIGMVGPYDKFAIEYGYRPFPGVDDPDDEKGSLDNILARQVLDPRLRFGNYRFSQDPSTQSEDIGSDAVEVGRLGLANIDRIASQHLWNATTKFGEDYERLGALRNELMGQRMTEIFHVMRMVGGVVETDYHVGRGGDVFKPVAPAKQRAAALFLLDCGLNVPHALFDPRFMNKISPNGIINQATSTASVVLSGLLSESRLQRMYDNEAVNGSSAYTADELLGDVTGRVFSDLASPKPRSDVYRRAIHRAYLGTMDGKVNGSKNDTRLYARAHLKSLAKRIDQALPKAADDMTRMHLAQTRKDIEGILLGKYNTSSGFDASMMDYFYGLRTEVGNQHCWSKGTIDPDLALELKGKK